MNKNKVKQVYDKISKYTYFNVSEKDDYIQVTEWANGEGWDINIGENKYVSLNHGELEAINYLINVLDHDFE